MTIVLLRQIHRLNDRMGYLRLSVSGLEYLRMGLAGRHKFINETECKMFSDSFLGSHASVRRPAKTSTTDDWREEMLELEGGDNT